MSEVLCVLGGGIGNIVQATPTVKAIAAEGHIVDLLLHCNSSKDVEEIFQISAVRRVYVSVPSTSYDYQLNGPFTPNRRHSCKKLFKTRINYAQHLEEAKVYYDLAQQMGVQTPMGDAEINIGTSGPIPKPNTIAIYPGSKPDWAMKRWDKYDQLAGHFENVVIIGKKDDIDSHGNPTWIEKPWEWPSHVEFFHGSLREAAYLISKCKLFVGNDGGLAHVAAGTGVPTFVIFGPSSDIKNKPYAKNAYVVAINLPCRPCQFTAGADGHQIFGSNKADCPIHMKCMRDMNVEYVLSNLISG